MLWKYATLEELICLCIGITCFTIWIVSQLADIYRTVGKCYKQIYKIGTEQMLDSDYQCLQHYGGIHKNYLNKA